MQSNSIKLGVQILSVLLFLGLYASLSYYNSGEILVTMKGEVQSCEVLGGSRMKSITHATMKSDSGSYIIASLEKCSPGTEVTILIKRGALYFNTVYAAERSS